jgi:hypothetical protein
MQNINIEIPEGHEIDLDKSNLSKGVIVFKRKKDEYDTIIKSLFSSNKVYYPTNDGKMIDSSGGGAGSLCYQDMFNSPTKDRILALAVINKISNIAHYFNKGEKADKCELKWYIIYSSMRNIFEIDSYNTYYNGMPYFLTKEDAQKALDMLNDEERKLLISW